MPEVIEARRQALNTNVLIDGTTNPAAINNMLGNIKDLKSDSAIVNGSGVNIKFEPTTANSTNKQTSEVNNGNTPQKTSNSNGNINENNSEAMTTNEQSGGGSSALASTTNSSVFNNSEEATNVNSKSVNNTNNINSNTNNTNNNNKDSKSLNSNNQQGAQELNGMTIFSNILMGWGW